MEAGRVTTGFSKPYVALYNNVGTTVTYTGLRRLARGVNVNISPESADDNKFYADNIEAESAAGQFAGGNVDLTVDGLYTDAERFIQGLPAPGADGWTNYGNDQVIPYMGLGFIVRYMSGGVTSYQPMLLTKVKFNTPGTEAATQEDEIDWQTQSLSASISRDDTTKQNWRSLGASFATEAEAELALKVKMGYVAPELSTLTIGALTLTPTFAPGTLAYTATTRNASDAVSATAPDDVTVVIKANGTEITSGDPVTWVLGANEIIVTATKGDDVTTYSVEVTALAEAVLSDITIGALTLTPTFDSDTDTYTATTTNASDAVSATAATGVDVTIEANSVEIASGDEVTWVPGDNTVTITVTNGVDTKTYTVTVTAS
jgi:phi13 family phage major tail protein